MGRRSARLVARATVALCLGACAAGVSPAAGAEGGKTIAEAPSLELNTPIKGELFDGAFYSGYSVAFYTASFVKGDRITIRTHASGDDTPPCEILYMPGTDDLNVGATTPLLDPATSSRNGTSNSQRFATVTETGGYVLAMTNADIFLSAPLQCLDAPAGRPFTFKVTVARGSGKRSEKKGGKEERSADGPTSSTQGGSPATRVVEPGQSLWAIAESLFGGSASVAQVAFKVDRLWQLNAARIGSGNPDLIFPGLRLRLK
jgi:nucleoid-associated protein YgaU